MLKVLGVHAVGTLAIGSLGFSGHVCYGSRAYGRIFYMQEILERAGLSHALSLEDNDPDADEDGDEGDEEGEERGGKDVDDLAAALTNKAKI